MLRAAAGEKASSGRLLRVWLGVTDCIAESRLSRHLRAYSSLFVAVEDEGEVAISLWRARAVPSQDCRFSVGLAQRLKLSKLQVRDRPMDIQYSPPPSCQGQTMSVLVLRGGHQAYLMHLSWDLSERQWFTYSNPRLFMVIFLYYLCRLRHDLSEICRLRTDQASEIDQGE